MLRPSGARTRDPRWIALLLIILSSASALGEGFAIIGDAGTINARNVDVSRKSLMHNGVNQLLLAGDNLYEPFATYAQVWEPWRSMGFGFAAVAIGNHNAGYPAEVAYFHMPGEYYSVVHGPARFVILNSDNDNTGPQQAAWLENELNTAKEPLLFVMFHHPPYTTSDFHNWKEKEHFHRAVRPVLQRHSGRINALFLGHDHVASALQMGGINAIISGAAMEQRPIKPVNYRDADDGSQVTSRWLYNRDQTWAWLRFGAQGPRVDYMDARTEQVACSIALIPAKMSLAANCGPGVPRFQ